MYGHGYGAACRNAAGAHRVTLSSIHELGQTIRERTETELIYWDLSKPIKLPVNNESGEREGNKMERNELSHGLPRFFWKQELDTLKLKT